MKKLLVSFLLISAMIAGCASTYMPPPPKKRDSAMTTMAEAATSVTSSLQTLEGIRKAENPAYQKNLPNPSTYNMNQLSSVDWTGPIEPLVKRLAKASNYRFRVLGTAPAIPVIVSISDKNVSLAEILRDADYQAGKKADIVVYTKSRTIELRYRKV